MASNIELEQLQAEMEQVSTISEPKSMKELFSALYESCELLR